MVALAAPRSDSGIGPNLQELLRTLAHPDERSADSGRSVQTRRSWGATVIDPPLPAGVEAKAFAMTIEPDEPGSSTPTMPIVMMGTGE